MKEAADLSLPQILLESAQRGQGILLLTGARDSGLEQTVETLIGEGRRAHRLDERPVPPPTDVVIVDADATADLVRRVLALSEEGRLVLWAMRAPSPLSGLRRALSLEFGEGRRHVLWRLMDQLALMSGQMRLKSLAGGVDVAREIILMTPPMRAALEVEDLAAAEELIKAGEETSGTVSFNQSLLQLLLRRRIDIKTAFESTRDPIHLDQILKKVGI